MDKSQFKILVAEDDRIVQDVIANFLSGEGYPVIRADDGLTAMEMIRLEEVRMVLTDLRMPGADGMEVLRAALEGNRRIPVVLMTAYGTLDTALEAMNEGAYDYIVKPFVMQQLLLVVRNAYRVASLIDENEKLTAQLKALYREHENLRALRNKGGESVNEDSSVNVEYLREQNIIDADEAAMLKERINAGSAGEAVKKYSLLVRELKGR
ncbi:MAG: response regulator [Nitrospiraceae bacterium]|nr:MAG: response regulator [Nitrospiraceae bacterium]